MAAVERQGQGRPNQHRPYPPGHARLSRRAKLPKIRSSIEEALDGLGEAEWLSLRSKQLVGQLRRSHRAGLRVGTALTEATANFLVNRRMNKSQQMRWTRRGADLLLQVRSAVYNG